MDEEKYRLFLAIAAVATTLTFAIEYGGRVVGTGVADAWGAATRHPWLAVGLVLPVMAGLTLIVVRWLDER